MKTFFLLVALVVSVAVAQPVSFFTKYNEAEASAYGVTGTGFLAADVGKLLDGNDPALLPSSTGDYTVEITMNVPDPGCPVPDTMELLLTVIHPVLSTITLDLTSPSGEKLNIIVPGQFVDGNVDTNLDEDELVEFSGSNSVGLYFPQRPFNFSLTDVPGTWTMTMTEPPRTAFASNRGSFERAAIGFWCDPQGTAQGDPHVVTLTGANEELDLEDGAYNMFTSDETKVHAKMTTTHLIGGKAPAQYMNEISVEMNCGSENVKALFDAEGFHFSKGSEATFKNGACQMASTSNVAEFHKDIAQLKLQKYAFYQDAHQVSFYTPDAEIFVFYTGHHYNVRVKPTESNKRSAMTGLLAQEATRDVESFVVSEF